MVKYTPPRVALYGGSFDPPHLGHEAVIRAASQHGIARIVVEPAWRNPFKTDTSAPAETRLKWCEQAFARFPFVTIDDYEISQRRSVTTFETLETLTPIYDIDALIVGADNLARLTEWYRFDAINRRYVWLVATRPGYDIVVPKALRAWEILHVHQPVSSTTIRAGNIEGNVSQLIESDVKHYFVQRKSMENLQSRIDAIVDVLDKNKAEEIEVFDLEGADYIAKRVVIANALNNKHTGALFDKLKEDLKPRGETFLYADTSDEWIVVDLGDILVHIMVPEYRRRYDLESFLNELSEKTKA